MIFHILVFNGWGKKKNEAVFIILLEAVKVVYMMRVFESSIYIFFFPHNRNNLIIFALFSSYI